MFNLPVSFTKFFKASNGQTVIWQSPNIPLIGWVLFLALEHVLPAGKWQAFAQHASFGFLFTWAWLEITMGASYFRRALGILVLLGLMYSSLY